MPPSNKDVIQVTILHDKARQTCDAACGVDWFLPGNITLARRQIKERFGNRARLRYFDLSKATPGVVKWNRIVKELGLSLPSLLIEGKPRISGDFDYRQLLDAIEAETEIRGK